LDYLNRLPLARPSPDATLSLSEDDINPAYREWIAGLKERVLEPVLGQAPPMLSEADWRKVQRVLSPYGAYLQDKKGAEVEGLPEEKLLRYRDGPFEAEVLRLIGADKKVAATLQGVREVERLLLYHQNLMRLANNFVSFPQLYSPEQRALFEMGSAVIDGRWFNFAVRVDEVAAHSTIAKLSRIFVLYLEVTLADTQDKFYVAVPATSGTKGNLSVGKRGVFFDIAGKEYDARVVQIIENPISLREALGSPFVRLWRFIMGKIEGLSGAAEQKLQKGVEKAAVAARQAAAEPAPQAAPIATAAPGGAAGLMVGVSVAIAALGSAFAFIVKTFAELGVWGLSLGALGALLAVMVPLIIAAVTKLRRQDLSALLEACGWAINARMRFDRQQRKWFTARVPYPTGAQGTPGRQHWIRIILLVALLGALLYGAVWGIISWTRSRRDSERPPAAPQEATRPVPPSETASQPQSTQNPP